MNRLPFAMPGRFWRGNLHTHSTRSDGHLDPAETVGWYRDNGYDFVALTDHFVRRYGYRILPGHAEELPDLAVRPAAVRGRRRRGGKRRRGLHRGRGSAARLRSARSGRDGSAAGGPSRGKRGVRDRRAPGLLRALRRRRGEHRGGARPRDLQRGIGARIRDGGQQPHPRCAHVARPSYRRLRHG